MGHVFQLVLKILSEMIRISIFTYITSLHIVSSQYYTIWEDSFDAIGDWECGKGATWNQPWTSACYIPYTDWACPGSDSCALVCAVRDATTGGTNWWMQRSTNIAIYSALRLEFRLKTWRMVTGEECQIWYNYDGGDHVKVFSAGNHLASYHETVDLGSSTGSASNIDIYLQIYGDSGNCADACYFDDVILKGIHRNPATIPTLEPTTAPTLEPTFDPTHDPTLEPTPAPFEPLIAIKNEPTATVDISRTVNDETTTSFEETLSDDLASSATNNNTIAIIVGIIVSCVIISSVIGIVYLLRVLRSIDENKDGPVQRVNSIDTILIDANADGPGRQMNDTFVENEQFGAMDNRLENSAETETKNEDESTESEGLYEINDAQNVDQETEMVPQKTYIAKCAACGEESSGKTSDDDGCFYCIKCWDSYEKDDDLYENNEMIEETKEKTTTGGN